MFDKNNLYRLNSNLVVQVLFPNDPERSELHVLDGEGRLLARVKRKQMEAGKVIYTFEPNLDRLKGNHPDISHLEEFLTSFQFDQYQKQLHERKRLLDQAREKLGRLRGKGRGRE